MPNALDEAGVAGRMDDRVVAEVFVGARDRARAGNGTAVVLGGASLRDEDVVEAGGGVMIEVWALGGTYACAVVAVRGSAPVKGLVKWSNTAEWHSRVDRWAEVLPSGWIERRKGDCGARGSGMCASEVGCVINVPKEGRIVADEVEMGWVAPGRRVERVRGSEDNVVHLEVLVGGYGYPRGDEIERPIVVTEGRGEDPILTCGRGGEVR